jgi:hypothetical protein
MPPTGAGDPVLAGAASKWGAGASEGIRVQTQPHALRAERLAARPASPHGRGTVDSPRLAAGTELNRPLLPRAQG